MSTATKLKPQAKAILAYLERQAAARAASSLYGNSRPLWWTCGTVFSRDAGFVGHDGNIWRVEARAQRIGELRRAGHNIESRRCRQHGHNVYEYRWLGGPE